MHSWLNRCTIGLTSVAVVGATLLLPTAAVAAGTDVVVTRPAASAPADAESATTAPVPDEVEVEQTAVETDPQSPEEKTVEELEVEPFRMAGVTWSADSDARDVSVRVQVRTRGQWGAWESLDVEDSEEGGRPGTVPLWTAEPADAIKVEIEAASGTPTDVKVTTIDPGESETITPIVNAAYSMDEDEGLIEEAAADGTPSVVPMPPIITRAQWGAGAGTKCNAPTTKPKALGVVIHHTAGSNTYKKSESAGLVRSYQTYHVKGHGWCDIGYNFLVDRFGQIFEGRKGGITKQVRAAHSGVEAVNQDATGVSMMGHFENAAPSAAMKTAVVKLVGWRLKYFGANPKGTYKTGGKTYQVINGHRDVKATACPGAVAYKWLGAKGGLRDRVAAYISQARTAAGSADVSNSFATPSSVTVTTTTTTATVRWKAVSGAPGYRVQVSPTGSSKNAKKYRTTATSITIPNLTSRQTYAFRVAVYDAKVGQRLSKWSPKPYTMAKMKSFSAPTNVRVTARAKKALRIKWPAQTNAPGYRVQLKNLDGKGKRYVMTTGTTVTVKKLKVDTRYQVRVAVVYPTTKARVSAYSKAPHTVAKTRPKGWKKNAPVTKPTSAPVKKTTNTVTPSGGKITFKGHGYGHGIGMSQYGAQGGARSGAKYDAILKKYYPGTTLSTKGGKIRVLISADTSDSVQVKHTAGLKLRTLGNNKTIDLPAKVGSRKVTDWSIDTAQGNKKKNSLYYKSGSTWYVYRTFPADGQFEGPKKMKLVLPNGSTREYRGKLRSTKPTATTRDTVNVLSMEKYIRGVVAREMPASWHAEALKAQAVAARTFGARYLGSSRHYDICDTTSCQVYGGVADETKATNQAVKATKKQILTYGGAPALTQFSSSSGGYTNQGSTAYLKPVADPWDDWSGNKNHSWSVTVSASTIQKKYPKIGTLKSISITKRNGYGSMGGRVLSMKLVGSKASQTITGVDARWAFGLKSDWFGF